MNKHTRCGILVSALVCLGLCAGSEAALAAPKKKARKAPRETSASVKRQEQSINQEIKLTQAQIDENEGEVKKNLAILNALEIDIAAQKSKVADLQTQRKSINNDIASCQANIKECDAKLTALRAQYISVIKKMRIARKKASPLAYIFASDNFYQAWRKMRYFQKFRKWRLKREEEIKAEIARLGQLNDQLARGHKNLDNNLAMQKQAEQVLAAKHAAQDETVKALRVHGDALRRHLAEKQAEANALSAKVMSLIAQEQEQARQAEEQRRRAEAQAKAKAEAERKAAEERAARERAEAERQARERAEQQRLQQEQAKQEQAQKEQAQKDKKKKEQAQKPKKETPKPKPKKETPKPKPEPKQETEKPRASSGNYAEARGRKPRGGGASSSSTPSSNAPATSAASGFAAAKGSLPRPVNGSFKVISKFGRHPLPDLPDVMFDNPGIDAVVPAGSSAQAVYDGVVTGVYVVNGFSTVVIVGHGDYYTVYGNIGKPTVSKGDKVKQGQQLGKLVADDDEAGRTTIHFEIYKNREKLNPEAWIR